MSEVRRPRRGPMNPYPLLRVGPKAYDQALRRPHVREMDFTGKPLCGMVRVEPAGFRTDADLAAWLARAAAFVATLSPTAAKKRTRRGWLDRAARTRARAQPGDGRQAKTGQEHQRAHRDARRQGLDGGELAHADGVHGHTGRQPRRARPPSRVKRRSIAWSGRRTSRRNAPASHSTVNRPGNVARARVSSAATPAGRRATSRRPRR